MSYSLERNEESELALLTFFGGVRLEDRNTALAELETLFTETGWRRVLVDLSSSHGQAPLKMRDALRHAWRLTGLREERKDLSIAYVFPDKQPPVLELIAASRGYVFERFANRTAALRWLRARPSRTVDRAADLGDHPRGAGAHNRSSVRVPRSYA